MSSRPLAAALSAVLLLASPAAVLAQSAGDDQYEDPFAGEDAPAAAPDEQGEPTEEPPGLGTAPSSATGSEGQETASESAETAPRAALPATGGEATLIALIGSGFVLAGAGLRVRLRADERRPA
jgi:hypothetical protein